MKKREDLFLISSISTLESKWVIYSHRLFAEECKNYIFATSLIGTTIQDRNKRKEAIEKTEVSGIEEFKKKYFNLILYFFTSLISTESGICFLSLPTL